MGRDLAAGSRTPGTPGPYKIQLAVQQEALAIDGRRLKDAVRAVLSLGAVKRAKVSLAIVDNAAIHVLNRRYLDHDEPTDVLSFVLESSPRMLEGQIVASAETAQAQAAQYGWDPLDELLLYVVHGALHLVGFDDQEPRQRDQMRAAEREILAKFGLVPRYEAP